MGIFSIVVSPGKLTDLADKLKHVNAETLGVASLRAVNAVATRAYDKGVESIVSGINLAPEYVKERMSLQEATDPNAPAARIVAMRKGDRPPTLGPSFGAQPIVVPDKYPNGSFVAWRMSANPRKPGSLLPWKPRIGNAALGVPAGMKTRGFSVSVVKGKIESFYKSASGNHVSFLFRAKNGMLLSATRLVGADSHAKGAIQVLRGPAVWQMFRTNVSYAYTTIANDLEKTLSDEVNREMVRLL